MKTKIILLSMMLCPIIIFGQTWDYPIKPGTEEWKHLNSNKEKVEVCQLPKKILHQSSTKDLLDICLKYPLLIDFYAFNDYYAGIHKLFNDFNGIRELYSRPDVLDVLLSKHSEILKNKLLIKSEMPNVIKGNYILSISTMELLLTVPDLQSQLKLEDKKKVMDALMKGYEVKKELPEYFKGVGFETNLLSRSQIITELEKIPFPQNKLYDEKFIDMINEKSIELIK